jgi:hypothetical protein
MLGREACSPFAEALAASGAHLSMSSDPVLPPVDMRVSGKLADLSDPIGRPVVCPGSELLERSCLLCAAI